MITSEQELPERPKSQTPSLVYDSNRKEHYRHPETGRFISKIEAISMMA